MESKKARSSHTRASLRSPTSPSRRRRQPRSETAMAGRVRRSDRAFLRFCWIQKVGLWKANSNGYEIHISSTTEAFDRGEPSSDRASERFLAFERLVFCS